MISIKIQSALNNDIPFSTLFNEINDLDLLDLHFIIQKYTLKSNNQLIQHPPPFHKLICLFFIKPEIINITKLTNFYSQPEKILLSFFSFSLNQIIPPFFFDININITKKYISQFPPQFISNIHQKINIISLSSLIDNYKKPIIQELSNNIDPFLLCKIISLLSNDSLIDEIKNSNYNNNIIIELKKFIKTSTQYSPIFLIFASNCLQNFYEFLIPIFLQQHSQTKFKVCPHIPLEFLNKIIQHLFYINLKNFDLSWLNFSNDQQKTIILFLQNKSQQINKILLSYNIKTIARKYETIKKTITICTAISNSIPPKNHFKISQKALQNFYKSGAISFIERNQYIIQ